MIHLALLIVSFLIIAVAAVWAYHVLCAVIIMVGEVIVLGWEDLVRLFKGKGAGKG